MLLILHRVLDMRCWLWLLPLLPSMLVMGGGPGSREALCVLAGRRLCFPRGELYVPTSGKEKQRDLVRIFREAGRKSNTESKCLKASMSELMGLYGLLRHFVETRCPADARIAPQLRLFAMSCKAVDMLLEAKRGLVALRELCEPLTQLLEKQMQLRQRLSARVVPKHHWAFDIAECFSQTELPILLDTFGTERLHLRTKAVAEHVDNMGAFEESVLSRVVALHASTREDRWAPTAELLGGNRTYGRRAQRRRG